MGPFFTKKQKALMRQRRKKAKESDEKAGIDPLSTENGSSKKKRPLNDEGNAAHDSVDGHLSSSKRAKSSDLEKETSKSDDDLKLETRHGSNNTIQVVIPSNLASKDVKKFRKDARRKLRPKHDDDPEPTIEFVNEENSGDANSKPKSKSKKKFPSIKELLKEKKNQEELDKLNEEKLAAVERRELKIPAETKELYRAIDCEMVGIGSDGVKSALARVSIVDWDGQVMLDTFVQVPTRVTDFRTHVSGITPAKISKTNASAMDEKKCRKLVASLLKDKILVGHGLVNDLKALMLQHPKNMIRDTTKYRPFQRFGNNKWRPRKLRDLAKENLENMEGFQEGSHDSVDDARATMEIYKTVHMAWDKSLATKNPE